MHSIRGPYISNPLFPWQMFQDETGELEGAAARLEWNHIP